MILTIAMRELKDHVLSLRFYLAGLLCLLLVLVSALVLGEEQAMQREALEPFLATDTYRQAADHANSNRLMNGGVFLTRPLPRLRSLVYGLDDLSLIAQVKGANHVLYLRSPLVANPVGQLFTSFDFLFTMGAMLSLVALVFTHDAVAGEAESGTLRLALALPVARPQLLVGKWLGAFAALAAIAVPCLLLAAAVSTAHPWVDWRAADAQPLALVAAACLLYAAAFVSLGLLLSCLCRTGRAALIGSLSAWAALVWFVPGVGAYLGSVALPADSPLTVEANINRIRFEAEERTWGEVSSFIEDNGWQEHEAADWNLEWGTWSDAIPRLAGELGEADRERLVAFSSEAMRQQLEGMEQRAAQLKSEHLQRRHRQVQLGSTLACASPLGAFALLLTDLSGTGPSAELRFRRAVERFKGDLVEYLLGQMSERSLYDQVDATSFPYFAHAGGRNALGTSSVLYVLVLVLYGVLFFVGAHLAFLKLEVR